MVYKSVLTDVGAEVLLHLIDMGSPLTLTRAEAGDGSLEISPTGAASVASPLAVDTTLVGHELIQASPDIIKIQVQVTNAGLEEAKYVREIGVYARNPQDDEFLFLYAFADGDDADNVLPASQLEDQEADTVHEHSLAFFISNYELIQVQVELSAGSYITRSEMRAYASQIGHTHSSQEVRETTGETTEQAQRRQDNDIQALRQSLDTGFSGTTVIHNFSSSQLQHWQGYSGGPLEGVIDDTDTLYL